MTVPIGIIIFCVYKLSDTRHIKSRVLRDLFPLLVTRNYQESSSNATFFWILSAGTWLSIGCGFECCLHLLKADRWPQSSSRLLDPGYLSKFMNSSISYTHSDLLLELSEFKFQKLSSSRNSRVPKVFKFQKLSSSRNSQAPKVIKFQKLSSSRNSQVPKVIKFQKLSSSRNSQVPETLELQKLSSSKKLSSSRNSQVPETLEFQKLSSSKNSQVPETLKFQKLSSSKSNQVPKYFWVPTNWVPSFRTSVPNYLCVPSNRVPSFRTRVPKYFWVTHTFRVPQNFKFHGTLPSSVISLLNNQKFWAGHLRPSPATPLRSCANLWLH